MEMTLELAKDDVGSRRLAGRRERQRLLAAFDASGLKQRGFAHQHRWLKTHSEDVHTNAAPDESCAISL